MRKKHGTWSKRGQLGEEMKLFLSFASLYCKGRVSLLCIWTSKQWLWSECRSSNTDWNLQLRHIWGTSRTRVKFFIPKPKTEKPKLFEKCKSCLSVFLNIYIHTHTSPTRWRSLWEVPCFTTRTKQPVVSTGLRVGSSYPQSISHLWCSLQASPGAPSLQQHTALALLLSN